MTTSEKPSSRRLLLTALVPIVIILIPLGYSLSAQIIGGDAAPGPAFLDAPREEQGQCVKPVEWMRYRHMDLLKEMRVDAVRDGNREPVTLEDGREMDITLSKCWECHKSRKQFCDRCHLSVNLHPDCFGCHYYPEWEEDHK